MTTRLRQSSRAGLTDAALRMFVAPFTRNRTGTPPAVPQVFWYDPVNPIAPTIATQVRYGNFLTKLRRYATVTAYANQNQTIAWLNGNPGAIFIAADEAIAADPMIIATRTALDNWVRAGGRAIFGMYFVNCPQTDYNTFFQTFWGLQWSTTGEMKSRTNYRSWGWKKAIGNDNQTFQVYTRHWLFKIFHTRAKHIEGVDRNQIVYSYGDWLGFGERHASVACATVGAGTVVYIGIAPLNFTSRIESVALGFCGILEI